MAYTDKTRDWLIWAVDQRVHDNNPYQYGYIVPIQDRRVIATATGYTAHYSWDIPDESQEKLYEHEVIQIVDFGFGQNIEAAKGWKTVVSAFTHLLDQFAACDSIQVDTASIIDALDHYDRYSEHGLGEDWEHIHLRYSEGDLHLNCTGSSSGYDLPVQGDVQNCNLSVTVQGRFLQNALSGFEEDEKVVVRIAPYMLVIGSEGEKLAVIMGMVSDGEK